MDKLECIFELQEKFNKRIGVHTAGMLDDEQELWIQNMARAISQEASELLDATKWKWWAKYQVFDKDNAKEEVIDLIPFCISAAQVLGMTAEDLHQEYLKKNEINHVRQDSGYKEK